MNNWLTREPPRPVRFTGRVPKVTRRTGAQLTDVQKTRVVAWLGGYYTPLELAASIYHVDAETGEVLAREA